MKGSLKENLVVYGITTIIVGVIILIVGFVYRADSLKTPIDYNTATVSDIQKGNILQGHINFNFGCYEEEYSTKFGIRVSEKMLYYAIPIGENTFMGYKIHERKADPFDEMTDNTAMYLTTGNEKYVSEPIYFQGKVCKMSKQDVEIFREYFEQAGYTTEQMDEYLIPYYIVPSVHNETSAVIFLVIGTLVIIAGISMFFLNGYWNKKNMEYAKLVSSARVINNSPEDDIDFNFDPVPTYSQDTNSYGNDSYAGGSFGNSSYQNGTAVNGTGSFDNSSYENSIYGSYSYMNQNSVDQSTFAQNTSNQNSVDQSTFAQNTSDQNSIYQNSYYQNYYQNGNSLLGSSNNNGSNNNSLLENNSNQNSNGLL